MLKRNSQASGVCAGGRRSLERAAARSGVYASFRHLVLAGALSLILGTSCASQDGGNGRNVGGGGDGHGVPTEQLVEVSIDPTLQASQAELPGLDYGPPREVGIMQGPDGPLEFVTNEIILHPASQQELEEFIAQYGATVLRDGMPLVHPEVEARTVPASDGWYLLRIDPHRSALDDLEENLARSGGEGEYRFSSEEAARTLALFARGQQRGIGLNPLVHFDASFEHPTGPDTYLDAEMFAWFTEDDDPSTPGDQGLSTGVTHAWDYLTYHGILAGPGVYYVPRIAIVDGGFDLDEVTGVPLNGNLDYGTLEAPIQYDIVDRDFRAGGPNLMTCSGGSDCPWHGQGAFGIAAARPRNLYGSAGVGGHFVRPVLIRVGTDMYHVAYAIRSAVIGGADVVSLSLSGGCGKYHWLCSIPPDDIYDMMLESVRFARSFLVPVVAAAGNEGQDVADLDVYPCKTEGVICVGSVDGGKMNVFNYGSQVDIWAPTGMRSTVTPQSAAADADDFGIDELYLFGGTSASTPFVAGAIGLMKAADQNLSYEQVLSILQSTANTSPDPRVAKGYVDVYRAVRGLIANQPPTVEITRPQTDATLGWRFVPLLQVNYTDPEVRPDDIYRWSGEVVYTSDLDGELCRSNDPPYTCTSTRSEMTEGKHIITATATDAFGATATDQVRIEVVNRPPEPQIIRPLPGDTLYNHIPILFGALVGDPDETIPDASIAWASSQDGSLGTGRQFTRLLTTGTHVITLTAVDGKGLTGRHEVTVSVMPGEGLPLPQITSPEENLFIGPGTMITLEGMATDPEDGTLAGASLEWRSSIDGLLGSGNSITVTLSGPPVLCNPESVAHTVTLTATDSDGHAVTVEIVIYVGVIC